MTYSIPAQCQRQPTETDIYHADKKYRDRPDLHAAYLRMCVQMRQPICRACLGPSEVEGGMCQMCVDSCRFYESPQWTLPPDNTVPATAKAILDIDKPKLTPAQQQHGENIQRALDRLNSGEHRYGFNEYQP